ncbi:hypothetical protein BgiMline_016621 [Biomphalaria glabrata]|uniref:Uncharacterized protein LOC106063198 n=1 Tax=Biomphalaria glabrata TaxID=6526 RepID=A0A9W3AM02_BIOGL|nr:uncharacterized protein LOC106063198 [Biomphalaria glabrata]KAI8758800.1 hypothetical protein BgiMline_009424 [Biomphalaria glabrata]
MKMDLRIVVIVTLALSYAKADCIVNCGSNFARDVQTHISSVESLCGVQKTYLKCMSDCVPGMSEEYFNDQIKKFLDQIPGSYTLCDLKNSGEGITAINLKYLLLLVFTVSLLLVKMEYIV